MTPTLPDNWPPIPYPKPEPKERTDNHSEIIPDDNLAAPTPVKLVRVAKFYFKEGK
jgi:hypothetical protein